MSLVGRRDIMQSTGNNDTLDPDNSRLNHGFEWTNRLLSCRLTPKQGYVVHGVTAALHRMFRRALLTLEMKLSVEGLALTTVIS